MSARILAGNHSRFQRIVDRTLTACQLATSGWCRRSLKLPAGDAADRGRAGGVTGFMFTKTSSELAPEEDQGALFAIVNGAALRDAGIHRRLHHGPDARAHEGHRGTRGQLLGRRGWAARPIPASPSGRSRTGPSVKRSQKEMQADIQARWTRSPACRRLSSRRPRCPAPAAACRSPWSSSRPAIRARCSRSPTRSGRRRRAAVHRRAELAVLRRAAGHVTIDRDRAAALGLPISDIGRRWACWSAAARSPSSTAIPTATTSSCRCRRNGATTRSGWRVLRAQRHGEMVPLSAVINMTTNSSPASIEQFNQLNSATTISALPLPGVTTGDGLAARGDCPPRCCPTASSSTIPASRGWKRTGQHDRHRLRAAIVVIYLVLAAQFESFRDPLIILMSVPLSIFGAMLPLNLGLGTLNIYTQVGPDHADRPDHQARHPAGRIRQPAARGPRPVRRDAIVASAKVRLRPILMTTAAMALASCR
jgi:multidrug efflux pump